MLLAAILLAAAVSGDPAPVIIDKVVAVVDDQVFFRSDLIAEAHRQRSAGDKTAAVDAMLEEVLDQFMTTAMIVVDAKRSKIDAESYEIDRALDAMAKERNTTVEKLLAEQEAAGVSRQLVRESVRRQIVVQRWVVTKVTPRIPRGLSAEHDKDAYQKAYETELRRVLAEIRPTMFVEVRK